MSIDEIIEKHKEIENIDLITISDLSMLLVKEHLVLSDLLNYVKLNEQLKIRGDD